MKFPDDELTLTANLLLGETEGLINTPKSQSSEANTASIETPVKFDLLGSYPNPFNPTTKIKFALPQNSRVALEVYSILGEKVATLVNEIKPAGYHESVFDGSNLASGIYIYRLTANSLETGEQFVKSAKMMLIK